MTASRLPAAGFAVRAGAVGSPLARCSTTGPEAPVNDLVSDREPPEVWLHEL